MAAFGARFRSWFGTKAGSPLRPSSAQVPARPGGSESFAEANNDFALAMYAQSRRLPGNVFFSPFSIRTALGMAHAGARGESAVQMTAALRISSSGETPHVAVAEIIQRLNAAGGGTFAMTVANSLWCQDGAPLQPGFLDVIDRYYAGGVNRVDFLRAAEAARARINQWVEEKTKQKIRQLIPSGGVSAETRLVLVNAVHFEGRWVLQFARPDTRDERFHLDGGGTVKAPLMYQDTVVRYMQASGYQAVDLVYRGGELAMLVLLPDRRNGLRHLEETLSAPMLHNCIERMSECQVKLFLPRFRITWGTLNVSDQLTALGMTIPFNRVQADFSGINGHQPPSEEALYISAVFHKAFVQVDEEGTEAAAATAVAMVPATSSLFRSRPPAIPIFRADHPFLFAIRDRNSGAILFLGRLSDPTREC